MLESTALPAPIQISMFTLLFVVILCPHLFLLIVFAGLFLFMLLFLVKILKESSVDAVMENDLQ